MIPKGSHKYPYEIEIKRYDIRKRRRPYDHIGGDGGDTVSGQEHSQPPEAGRCKETFPKASRRSVAMWAS